MMMESFGDQSLHWLLESVPDPLVLVNEEGRIVGANAAMASLFRYTEEDLSGLMIEDLVPQRMRGDHARWRQCRRGRYGDREPTAQRPAQRELRLVLAEQPGGSRR